MVKLLYEEVIMKKNYIFSLVLLASIFTMLFSTLKVHALGEITFPVTGAARYSNDFDSPRSNGPHHATDIIAQKMQQIVSATDGTITYVGYPQPSWGYMVSIKDAENYTFNYIHINNDTPGTDDGNGGPMLAYAADIKQGNKVVAGQHIAWVGDSGNAETTVSHLHFEIVDPNGNAVNPYDYLRNAKIIPQPVDRPQLSNELLPYGPDFNGNGSIAPGNFDQDNQTELVVGAGPGGGPHVKVVDNDLKSYLTLGFLVYDDSFKGGVDVAAGDIDGDGVDEIITGAGPGGGPHVKAFEKDGTPANFGFFAYDESFRGGIRVAAGDIDGDGVDEIITGAGPGGGPDVRVFKKDGILLKSFYAYTSSFSGGVDVAAGNVNTANPNDEIITGAGAGGGSHVIVFNKDGQWLNSFFAYGEEFKGGVKVSVGNVRTSSPQSEIMTAPLSQGGPQLKLFDTSGSLLSSKMGLEEWWVGNYDVAAGNGTSFFSTGGNRRMSIRIAP